jgi:hypothetical protein
MTTSIEFHSHPEDVRDIGTYRAVGGGGGTNEDDDDQGEEGATMHCRPTVTMERSCERVLLIPGACRTSRYTRRPYSSTIHHPRSRTKNCQPIKLIRLLGCWGAGTFSVRGTGLVSGHLKREVLVFIPPSHPNGIAWSCFIVLCHFEKQ